MKYEVKGMPSFMKDELKKKDEEKLEEMKREIDEAEAAEEEDAAEEAARDVREETAEGSREGTEEAENGADDPVKRAEKLEADLAEKDAQMLRLRADFDNFRRRSVKEREELAAVVTLVALYMLPRTCDAFLVLLLRILLAAAFGGGIAPMLYSLAGGAASFAAMALLKARTSFSVVGISAVGGFLHNMGQLGVAAAVMQTDALLIYAPVLGIAGILTGLAVGLLTKQILQKISTG